MRVAVVTPTIGSEHLAQCLESIQNQTYGDIVNYVFLDGKEHFDKIYPTLSEVSTKKKIRTIELQENIGKGWYGHRVYAACSFIVNADIICYLDEDNWIEPDHVESIVQTIKEGNDWVYSLRKIVDKGGQYVCDDNCESLGKWPVYFNDKIFHVDTSCFGIRRDTAVRIGHAWYGQWGADRQFFSAVSDNFKKYNCTSKYTVNYRLDANPNSVNNEFFIKGNDVNSKKYNNEFPWKTKKKMLEIGPGITIVA
jgi:glycosyltransferase involved in cell wall biosynthesis